MAKFIINLGNTNDVQVFACEGHRPTTDESKKYLVFARTDVDDQTFFRIIADNVGFAKADAYYKAYNEGTSLCGVHPDDYQDTVVSYIPVNHVQAPKIREWSKRDW